MRNADSFNEKKRRLFALLLYEKGMRKASLDPLPEIKAVPEHLYEPFELNKLQKLYWQGENGDLHAHMYFEFELVAKYEIFQLELALNQLIKRHPMLRAVVLPEGHFRILKEVPPYKIRTWDLTALSPQQITKKMSDMRKMMIQDVPLVDSWPLFDIFVCKTGNGIWRLLINFSLLVDDGLSNMIFFRELLTLYNNPDTELEPIEISYRDYAVAMAGVKSSDIYRQAEKYWEERISRLPPNPKIPIKKFQSTIARPLYVRRSVMLSPDIWRRLQQEAKNKEVTASSVLLAAFGEVLGRITEDDRYVINVMHANRLLVHPQVNKLFGNFSSSLLHIIDRTERRGFWDFAKSVQQQLWNDLEHCMVSAIEIIERTTRKQTDFPVSLPVAYASNLFAAGIGEISREGATEGLKHISNALQRSQVMLDVQVNEIQGVLSLNCDFVEQSIPEDFVEKVLNSYRIFLEELAEPIATQTAQETTKPAKQICFTGKSSLIPLQKESDRSPFFCVHPVGGGCFEFVPLAKILGPCIPFFGFQAPGLEGEHEPLTSIEDMADRYISLILKAQKNGPYHVGGFSFGALIAFEIAKRLSGMGYPVGHLIFIDGIAPSPGNPYPMDDNKWLEMVAKILERSLGIGIDIVANDFQGLPFDAQRSHFEEMVQKAGVFTTPEEKIVMRGLLDVSLANYWAACRYSPNKYHGKIELIRARNILPEEEILTFRENYEKADFGWGTYSTQPVEIHEISGDHYSILRSPDVDDLGRVLTRILTF